MSAGDERGGMSADHNDGEKGPHIEAGGVAVVGLTAR